MKTSSLILRSVLVFMFIALVSSCEMSPFLPIPKNPQKFDPNAITFHLDEFETNLELGMGNQWVGYAYVINQKGKMVGSGTFGNWTRGADGNTPADLTTPIYLASVNKAITSVAMFRAFQEFGSGPASMLNKTIETYLPPYWLRGSQIQTLRFWDLLTHKSGFQGTAATSFDAIKNSVMFDETVGQNRPYQYSNLNYSFLMYLLPQILGVSIEGSDAQQEQIILQTFDNFVRARIFQPAGITSATTIGSAARYYRWGDLPQVAGWNMGDRTSFLGRGGYYLSAIDVARFLAYLNHTESFINKTSRALMYLNAAGWSDGGDRRLNPINGERGVYFAKGGSLCNAADRFGNCNGQGVSTMIMVFPDDIEVVVLGNTRGGNNDTNLVNILRTAYDDSWH